MLWSRERGDRGGHRETVLLRSKICSKIVSKLVSRLKNDTGRLELAKSKINLAYNIHVIYQ